MIFPDICVGFTTQVLDNGLLVDPHDQQDIANALLKLVAERQLWARCRHNGLRNIHLFSWPEHCKTYLSRLTSCRPRQPRWRRAQEAFEAPEPDSPNDSLRDIQDISLNLKLSLDGERAEEENNAVDGGLDSAEGKLESAAMRLPKGVAGATVRANEQGNSNSSSKFPAPRRRKPIFVIAVDCDTDEERMGVIQRVLEVVRRAGPPGSGLILSTSLTISEVHSLLTSRGVLPTDFDAFICSSGSDIYYPSPVSEEFELPFTLDLDYRSHIEYRWGGEDLRRTLLRWAASSAEEEQIVAEDEQRSSTYCLAFSVKNPEKVNLPFFCLENPSNRRC